jgi:transmembrane sensor
MDELAQKLVSLRDEVVPPWDRMRRERAFNGVVRRQRRQRLHRVVGAAGGALLMVCGSIYLRSPLHRQARLANSPNASEPAGVPEPRLVGAEPSPRATGMVAPTVATTVATAVAPMLAQGEVLPTGGRGRLADGSDVEVSATGGRLLVESNDPDHIELRLAAGGGHFEVVPNTQRHFSVLAGSIEVVVVGTAFDVERIDNRVRVAVTHGTVRVHSMSGVALVHGGESRWFEQQPGAATSAVPGSTNRRAQATVPATKPRERGARTAPSPGHEETSPDWRSLNRSGDYEGAYRLLEKGAPLDDDSEALMDAADAARLSNHPEVAETYLRKVLRDHRASPATPLAAFTLGRVLLERLGRPSEAAAAFATVRELAPQGSLAQDALAREVEAWSKAGHAQEAYQRARTFIERYPDSRRLRVVELYGGLRAP